MFRFKAEIQWDGEHVVEKYLSTLARDSLYRQIRSAACTANVDQQTMEDAIDLAMMDFGRGVIRTVGGEIDRLEGELKVLVPGLAYVDLETDRNPDPLDKVRLGRRHGQGICCLQPRTDCAAASSHVAASPPCTTVTAEPDGQLGP